MDAGVEDVPGRGEDRLGPVAVVDVPVEDQDPFRVALGPMACAAATAALLKRQNPIDCAGLGVMAEAVAAR